MGEIYRLSSMTIVWPGIPCTELDLWVKFFAPMRLELRNGLSHHKDWFLQLLGEYRQHMKELRVHALANSVDEELSTQLGQFVKDFGIFCHSFGETLANVMACAYWNRVWVVQELASSRPVLMASTMWLDMVELDLLLFPLMELLPVEFPSEYPSHPLILKLQVPDLLWDQIEAWAERGTYCFAVMLMSSLQKDAWHFVRTTQYRECYDCRDQVFACQAMLPLKHGVAVNYDSSKERLCFEGIGVMIRDPAYGARSSALSWLLY